MIVLTITPCTIGNPLHILLHLRLSRKSISFALLLAVIFFAFLSLFELPVHIGIYLLIHRDEKNPANETIMRARARAAWPLKSALPIGAQERTAPGADCWLGEVNVQGSPHMRIRTSLFSRRWNSVFF